MSFSWRKGNGVDAVGEGVRRTTLAGYELADIAAVGAMDVGEEGREAGNGDVLRQEVEFGDSVPNIALGGELEVEGQLKVWAGFDTCSTYHVDDEDLRRNWALSFVSPFLDISCFQRRCDNGRYDYRRCKQGAPTVGEMHCSDGEESQDSSIEASKDGSVRQWAVLEGGGGRWEEVPDMRVACRLQAGNTAGTASLFGVPEHMGNGAEL